MTAKMFVLLAVLCLAVPSFAQQPVPDWQTKAGGKMSFEVASIRPAEPEKFTPPTFALDASNGFSRDPHGLFKAGFALDAYIEFAYKLWLSKDERDAMLANQPKWVTSQSFVIDARAPANATKDQMRLMMQSLLAERFHLQLRYDKREMPVLVMTLAKPGKLGTGLNPHADGPACDAPILPTDAKVFPVGCNTFALLGRAPTANAPPRRAGARNEPMNLIADSFSVLGGLDRPIVDRTGLTGEFDYSVQWVPESPSQNAGGANAQTESGPTFLEALQEQLGLQLKPAKVTIEVPVIAHVELPSEN